ncbi:MAG: hypothetical protein G01um101418_175 [Parcubacteria group bacterium Gr01-1014_18]|nr:MAG: hypothetical protein Greene041636_143 [Parcubacteria group bacterium Greene0416_36]TSC81335.1 MAG: hypothetical protein G01um101418_175 [Parcubacteria group bacterium Gr01-1014_18]TSC99479.1 MAG: hypothetical protein Greene101420_146 [Parcubacteria group bacterium Greene1014_20]TSD07602.1 MAG: hypothetical protein Greene07142_59 [Parcubacteria group bacterium Greene0714_2]
MQSQILTSSTEITRATKKELMDAYHELLKKYKDDSVSSESKSGDPKKESDIKESGPVFSTGKDIFESIHAARGSVQDFLGQIEGLLMGKFSELKKMEEQLAHGQSQLKLQYDIEANSASLLALIRANDESRQKFDKEKTAQKQLWAEEVEASGKQRKRDEEEYLYALEIKKKKDAEEQAEMRKKFDQEIHSREKVLIDREKNMADKESEFTRLQALVSNFDARIEETRKHAAAETEKRLKIEHEVAMTLLKKEMDTQKIVDSSKIHTLESLMESQKQGVRELQEQLAKANSQVQEVVLRTIDSSAGGKALDAVNKIALEQAKGGVSQNKFGNNRN